MENEKKFVVKEVSYECGIYGKRNLNEVDEQETIIAYMINSGYRLHTVNSICTGRDNDYIRITMYFEKID